MRPSIVVYDVGHVLVDWDPRHLYRKLFRDPAEMEWFLAVVCSPAWNRAQDGGRPWPDGEAEAIARHPSYADMIRAYRSRWQEMVPGLIEGAVSLLEDLSRAQAPLYAITNFAGDTFRETTERFPIFHYFRGICVSSDLKLLKPEPAIYHALARRFGIDLKDCVFIDDTAANVAGARSVGMDAIHFSSTDQTRVALIKRGFRIPAQSI